MILTLALCCVREHRDEKEAQQAETQSDCEPHPDTSRPKDTIHLIGKAVQEEKADNRVEKKEEVKKEMNEQERTGQGVRLGGNRTGVRQPREDDKGGKRTEREVKERGAERKE